MKLRTAHAQNTSIWKSMQNQWRQKKQHKIHPFKLSLVCSKNQSFLCKEGRKHASFKANKTPKAF